MQFIKVLGHVDHVNARIVLLSLRSYCTHDFKLFCFNLLIEKSSDKDIYKQTDTAKYTLKVTQIREDYTARNVVIRDAFDTEFASIVDGSIKVMMNKNDITSDCDITLIGNAFEISTGKDLAWGDTILVTYDVMFAPEAVGEVLTNIAIAKADNADDTQDENTVGVDPDPAELRIVKTSDKQTYKVGDTAKYTLNVSCISKSPAINVSIQDKLDITSGASIVDGSIKVLFGEQDITVDATITVSGQTFNIETGKALAEGENIIVTYNVLIQDPKLVGKQMKNIAVASSSNAEDVSDDNIVNITSAPPKDEPKEKVPVKDKSTKAGSSMPQTGDNFKPWIFIVLMIGAAGFIVAIIYKRRMKLK